MDREKFSGFVTSVAFTLEGNNSHIKHDRMILVSILPIILLSAKSYAFSCLVKLFFEWYLTVVTHMLFLVFVPFLFLADVMLQRM